MSEQTDQNSKLNTNQLKRPFSVRLLTYAFGFWSVLGWLRFIRTVMEREFVLEVLSQLMFIYLIVSGLFWGLAALPAIWGLLRRGAWVKAVTWIVAVLFPVLYWFEREVLWRDLPSQGNGWFIALLTLLWLGLVFWAMQSRAGRNYFSIPYKGNN